MNKLEAKKLLKEIRDKYFDKSEWGCLCSKTERRVLEQYIKTNYPELLNR